MNKQHLSVDHGSVLRNQLDNGQIEEIHTMPKKDYYASLRVSSSLSVARSASRTTLSKRSSVLKSSRTSVYKESGKLIACRVTMLDSEEKTFEIDANSFGSHLFERVINDLDLTESEYFCLRYDDAEIKTWCWLQMDKKITEQLKKNKLLFEFQVKFYTPHINNIVEDLTRYFFCLQVRQNIYTGIIPASFNILILLGAYAVQSEAGDYDKTQHNGIEYIRNMDFAPKLQQTDELLTCIADLHKQISLQSPEEADRTFLWNATKLAMYGIDMHRVKNSENEEVSVGVYHSGIVVYRRRVRVNKYSWPRIIRLSYKNKTFYVMLRNTDVKKSEITVEFKCAKASLAKRLWLACAEHHAFFRMIDAENPGKPRLNPGFGTRKYRLGSQYNSTLESEKLSNRPSVFVNRPVPKVRRMPTQRQDREGALSPSGMAPVADVDEVFTMDGNAKGIRPELPIDYWKMYQEDSMPQIAMDVSGLDVCGAEGTGWQGTRGNKGVKDSGKYYYEGKIVEDGLVRFGWSTNDASLDLGSDRLGFGYGNDQEGSKTSTGFKRNDGEEKPYGQQLHEGDVIGCSIDLDNGRIQWSKNGIPFEIGYQIPEKLRNEPFFPATSIKDGRILFNFGDLPMEFMPTGDWSTLVDAPEINVIPNKYAGWRMNPYDSTKGTAVSENGLIIQSKFDDEWHGCRANKGLFDAGKFYYEVTPLEEDGLARVGWATDEGNLNLGSDKNGFGYGSDNEGFGLNFNQGKKMTGNEIENYGDAFGKSDVIGCFLDLDNQIIKWAKNGTVYKEAFIIPSDLVELRAFYPTASFVNNTLDFNFGNKPFGYYPGNEWIPVCFAANGNTESSRKESPWLLNRPNSERQESVLELRRQNKLKVNSELENAKKQKETEDERKQRLIRETERIEMQEREKRLLLQKQREENESKKAELERIKRDQEFVEKERIRLEEEENNSKSSKSNHTENIVEESETIIKGPAEVSEETFVDEQGRTVTRILRKTKVTKCMSINHSTIERTEDEINSQKIYRLNALAPIVEDDDELLRAIIDVTGLSPSMMVLKNVRMSIASLYD